jgi:hypothetical protein
MDDINTSPKSLNTDILVKEIGRVHTYWMTRTDTHSDLTRIMCVGRDVEALKGELGKGEIDGIPVDHGVNVWKNAFDINDYVPGISRSESLEYAVAAGLALPL